MIAPEIVQHLRQIRLPAESSHKGLNGKLLIVGGSQLFHAASKWSLDVASNFVDMVFYSSVPENNSLLREAKSQFWNGIVVPRETVNQFAEEADAVLIGPGMTRTEDTKATVDALLAQFPHKKWVVDAGALQMVDPHLLTSSCIVTPHQRELEALLSKQVTEAELLSRGVTILAKGRVDEVCWGNECVRIEGGNAGMTKGGTGDVLAGLVAALYCLHDAPTAAIIGSYVNKRAGEMLAEQVGPFFNASALVGAVPKALWQALQSVKTS